MRPRRTRRGRLLRRVALLALLLAATIAFVRSPRFLDWAASLTASGLEEVTGEDVVIGGMELEPLRGRLALNGVVITRADPADPYTIAAIDQVEVRWRIKGWRPIISQIRLERPVLRLRAGPGGLREFRGARKSGKKAPAARYPWESLIVRDGDVSVAGEGFLVHAAGLEAEHDGEEADAAVALLRWEVGELGRAEGPFSFPDLTIAPGRFYAPELDLRFPELALRGSLGVGPDKALSGELSAWADLSLLRPILPPTLGFTGEADLDVSLGGTTGDPRAEGALAVPGVLVRRKAKEYPLGHAVATWTYADEALRIAPFRSEWGGGLVELQVAIDLPTKEFQALISAEDLSVREALIAGQAAKTPWVDMRLDMETHLSGTLSPLSAGGTIEMVASGWEVGSGPLPGAPRSLYLPTARLEGPLAVTGAGMQIRARRLVLGGSSGAADIDFGFADGGSVDMEIRLDQADLATLRPLAGTELQGRGALRGRLHGPFKGLSFQGEATLADFGFLGFKYADSITSAIISPDLKSLLLPGFQAKLGDSRLAGQLVMGFRGGTAIDLQMLVSDGKLADLAGIFLDVPGLDAGVEGLLSLRGPVRRLDGEVELRFADVDLFGEPFAAGRATAWMEEGRFTLEEMAIWRSAADGAEESLLARGSVGAGWAANIEILGGGLRLERLRALAGAPVRGSIALDARIGGTLFEPEPHGRLAIRETTLAGQSLGDTTLYFDTANGLMQVGGAAAGDGLGVEGWLELWDQRRYSFVAGLEGFPVHALYPRAPDGSPIDARVSGRVLASGALSADVPPAVSAALRDVRLRWGGHDLRSTEVWRYEQVGGEFSIEGVSLKGGRTDFRLKGVQPAGGRRMLAGEGAVELDLLRMVVPDLTRAEGVAQVNLSLSRQGGRQDVAVDVALSDGLIEGTWFPHPIEGVSGDLTATPAGYELRDVKGRIGGGQLELSGQIAAEGWIPARYQLAGTLKDAQVRYLDFLPPIVGDAQLRFDGPAGDLLLSGDIQVDEMVFVERIDWESYVLELTGEHLTDAVAEETSDLFAMDIAVTAPGTVRMRNNVADLTADARLRILGTTAKPGVLGVVRAEPGGRVYLKERSFELQRGELTFVEPFTFDPDVDIELTTDIRSQEQEYTIEYRVMGTYSSWYTATSSDPPLSQADINALLLFGMTGEELERYGGLSSALVFEGGDLLASNLITSKIGIVDRVGEGVFQVELLQLDRVDLVSGVSERGSRTVSSEPRLLAEKDLSWGGTLVMEQNLLRSSDTYLSLEQRLARKLYLQTYWAGEQQGRYLNIGGAYGLSFNLRWELD